jgi:hypothetical protein
MKFVEMGEVEIKVMQSKILYVFRLEICFEFVLFQKLVEEVRVLGSGELVKNFSREMG